jgi:hypothetical protein
MLMRANNDAIYRLLLKSIHYCTFTLTIMADAHNHEFLLLKDTTNCHVSVAACVDIVSNHMHVT